MHQLPQPNERSSDLAEGKKVSGRESHGGVSSNVVMMPDTLLETQFSFMQRWIQEVAASFQTHARRAALDPLSSCAKCKGSLTLA